MKKLINKLLSTTVGKIIVASLIDEFVAKLKKKAVEEIKDGTSAVIVVKFLTAVEDELKTKIYER